MLLLKVSTYQPGPDPLLSSLKLVQTMLESKRNGTRLEPIEVMDMINILSECVLASPIRRSAMICMFSPDDHKMLHAKDAASEWWNHYPWRARSNNSAVLLRTDPKVEQHFNTVWRILSQGRSGEPGIFFTNDETRTILANPCVEISLNPYQFCNLTEINTATITSQADFNERARAAALIGTLQAGYTSFNYVRDQWTNTTAKEALLGVSLTGMEIGRIYDLDETVAAQAAVDENIKTSALLNINKAARVTSIKPAGSTSLIFGCASGIHSLHSPYYIRRLRIGKDDPLYNHLLHQIPDLLEDDIMSPQTTAVLSVPVNARHARASYRNESPLVFLERIKRYQHGWIAPGHSSGINTHSVSATATLEDSEWEEVGQWLWKERNHYTCISIFPATNSIYKQTPFEECDKTTFDSMYNYIKDVDLDNMTSHSTTTDFQAPACAGGVCEL